MKWVIRNLWTQAYWNNSSGWTQYRLWATVFSQEEKETLSLPIDGVWREFQEGKKG